MINDVDAYFLGLMYSKGDIIQLEDDFIAFRINIKFRRPNDEAVRSDNIYTKITKKKDGKEKLTSRFTNDIYMLTKMLQGNFGFQFSILQESGIKDKDWSKKIISITSSAIRNNNKHFTSLFCVDKIEPNTLQHFPFKLKIESDIANSLAFVQGACDACSLVPNEASSQNSGNGTPRIQLEPNQDRWEFCLALCYAFQEGLNIRVNNINWGHPQIRTKWRGQNHQFRVLLSDIPKRIQLYRLTYKNEEYINLYKRRKCQYQPSKTLCPLEKRGLNKNDILEINKSNDSTLNDKLLHKNLRGYSINVSGKKSIIVCKLLGCKKCKNFFTINIKQK